VSATGLSYAQRVAARKRLKRAALLVARRRGVIHYTQSSRRWDFIRLRRRPSRGSIAYYADCSSLATALIWDACRVRERGLRDFVNGAGWRAGYTGTMVRHGARIGRPRLVGDCVFYGGSRSVPGHVALYIGNGLVVSHGSEAGPLIIRWNYRPVVGVRRYIR
jgi:hypothetical protein